MQNKLKNVWWEPLMYRIFTKNKTTNVMNILEQIENLKTQKSSARTNSEINNIEKKIIKLAKMYNSQNHYQRFFIYNGNVYGLEKNPNYLDA